MDQSAQPTNQQPVSPPQNPSTHRNFVSLIVVAVVAALLASLGTYFVMSSNQNKESQMSNQQPTSTQVSPTQAVVPTTATPDAETANWKTYTNPKYTLSFRYPDDWRVTYDKQPDPSGNPTKHSVILTGSNNSTLSVTILKSDQYQTFESLSGIGNLPSGPATITSQKEITVAGNRALYIRQNNKKEGVVMLDSDKNMVIFEVNSTDKETLNNILPTIEFSK